MASLSENDFSKQANRVARLSNCPNCPFAGWRNRGVCLEKAFFPWDQPGAEVKKNEAKIEVILTVCHSEVYQVPVMYFYVCYLDGAPVSQISKALSFLRTHPEFANAHAKAEAEKTLVSPMITHAEHPVRRTPCFMLHPCQTPLWLAQVLEAEDAANREKIVLLAWLAKVCPAVGLKVQPTDFLRTKTLLLEQDNP